MTDRILFVAANPSVDRLYEVERLAVGAIHRPELVVAVPGGKGLNAARAAASLGGRVTVVGIVGGRSGDWIRDEIAARGIEARWTSSAALTRTCVSILDRSTGDMTEIYERGEPIEATAWEELERAVAAELATGDVAVVALSGSLPPGAPQIGFGRIAAMAGSVPVLADTYGAALRPVLAERPEVVKVNAGEAGEAMGIAVTDAASAAAAARALVEAGAANAVVTLGLDGAVVASAAGGARLVPPPTRGAYPVGSGDAFLGGMAVGFARGDGVVEAARLGLAAGIANALVPGAGELDPDEVGPILGEVSIVSET
jgi:1-phosphofructokinase family hexose kinase